MSTPLHAHTAVNATIPSMAEGNPIDQPGPFDLDAWALQHQLNRKTTSTLRREQFAGVDALKLATSSDINRMDIAVGQVRLVRVALRALGNPIKVDDLITDPGEGTAGEEQDKDEDRVPMLF